VNASELVGRFAHWIATRPLHTKALFGLAVAVFLTELALRRFAPRSRFYAKWTHGFEAVGSVWTAIILSLVYIFSVGPVSLGMRLLGRDLLDKRLQGWVSTWRVHQPNPLETAARHQF
jgi:hypothetical protein